MRERIARMALSVALAVGACSHDGPSGPTGGQPIDLPIFGLGRVAERFTAEVAVRGNNAYTSTWGSRNGTIGNAIKVWDVTGSAPALVDSVLVSGAVTTGDVEISDDGRLLLVATE